MSEIFTIFVWFTFFCVLIRKKPAIETAIGLQSGLWLLTAIFSPLSWLTLLFLLVMLTIANVLLFHTGYRHTLVTRPLFERIAHHLPQVSETEQVALDSGDTWWEQSLFCGAPNWVELQQIRFPKLTAEEEAFLDGPCEHACQLANNWEITRVDLDLSDALWAYLKAEGFFGLIIPKQYGGKGFSALAHAMIVAKLASKSITLSTTVAVPNTLGPAELLLHYGTDAQRNHYLPDLACGRAIPCFALTHPEAGSDASAIPDSGIVCERLFEGKPTLGFLLNWNKRYITLAPIATVLGLAFKAYDPEQLLGDTLELGITCALIPTTTSGVVIGRRHHPLTTPFQNGPTQGKNVFIPLDWVIGGPEMIGQGWRMLMECLSAGRAITLPSATVGGAKFGVLAVGAYARIRRQFNTSLSNFEGVQEMLARVAGFSYIANSTRLFTAIAIDHGKKPSVASAIAKCHVTGLVQKIAVDIMDVFAGKAVIVGPNNHVAYGYESAPISVTVEGANSLTRNMIIFGQGALRCHPFLKAEVDSIRQNDFAAFDRLILEHTAWLSQNAVNSITHAWTGGYFATAPNSKMAHWYKKLSRASATFAFVADVLLIIMGGKLKSRESVSARLGDLLSDLYMASSCLRCYQEDGEPSEDAPLVEWSMHYVLNHFWSTLHVVTQNLPVPGLGRFLRLWTMPCGNPVAYPGDKLSTQVSNLITAPTATRNRLIAGMYNWQTPGQPAYDFDQTLAACIAAAPLEKKLHAALKEKKLNVNVWEKDSFISAAADSGIFTTEEAELLTRARALAWKLIQVDDFPAHGGASAFISEELD
ncbi:MAG: acyl-CoA dehydrogenase [Pseudomonadota bacterium]